MTLLKFSRKLCPYDDRERRLQFVDFSEFRSNRKPLDSLGQPGDIFFNTNVLSLHIRLDGSKGWSKPWDGSFKNRLAHPLFEDRSVWIIKRRKGGRRASTELRLEFCSAAIIQKNLFLVSAYLDLLRGLKISVPKSSIAGPSQSRLGKRKMLADDVLADSDQVDKERGAIEKLLVTQLPLSMSQDALMNEQHIAHTHMSHYTTKPPLAPTQTFPQSTNLFLSPVVPPIATLSEPGSEDISELSALSDLDDECDELLPTGGNNSNMQPPSSHLLESQQLQIQAMTVTATVTAISTSLKTTMAQEEWKGPSPSWVAPSTSTSKQSSSPSVVQVLPSLPLRQEPTPKIVHSPSKSPIIIQDSDSDYDGDGVEQRSLPVPVSPVPVSIHSSVPPVLAKSMKSQCMDKSAQIVDLTFSDDEDDVNLASNSGIFPSQTLSTKLQTPLKLVHGLRCTGTGTSVQDAIDLDAGSDGEENNPHFGDEIMDITAEQYEAAAQISQSHTHSGHVKGKTMKGSTSILTPIPTPMKAKAKIATMSGVNVDNLSSIQPSSQTKSNQLNASCSDSTTPKRTVDSEYPDGLRKWHLGLLYRKIHGSGQTQEKNMMVICVCCADDAESSQVSLPAVKFPSNAVRSMLQHARNTHSDSVFYNLVVKKSQEEVELEIRETRRKRRRM